MSQQVLSPQVSSNFPKQQFSNVTFLSLYASLPKAVDWIEKLSELPKRKRVFK